MWRRNSLRLEAYDYDGAGAYFVTVCTRGRACLLGRIAGDRVLQSRIGRIVETCWHRLPGHHAGVELDAFVVMPNHVHGIVVLTEGARQASPLHVVVGSFKACSSWLAGRPLWQRGYFERVVRDEAELALIRQYVTDNPLRWTIDEENVGARPASPGLG